MSRLDISKKSRRFLVSRFRERKKYNGACLGNRLCVDNLGKSYDRDSIRRQFLLLLSNVNEIRFAGVEINDRWYPWGWCCIEFTSTEAAISAMAILDDVYLRMGAFSHILRPLLPHFPMYTTESVDQRSDVTSTDTSISLHLGQVTTVNHESKEFIRLWRILSQTKMPILQKIESELLPLIQGIAPQSSTNLHQTPSKVPTQQFPGLWLDNVPSKITDEMLCTFFACSDQQVETIHVADPVSIHPRRNVLVRVSTREKAEFIRQDLDKYLLLYDGFRPIRATIVDFDKNDGFESLFDRVMKRAGMNTMANCGMVELIWMKTPLNRNDQTAAQIRVVLERMQHSRGSYRRLKMEREQSLHDHLSAKVDLCRERFAELVNVINNVETTL